jgi:hypothetical protein
MANPVITLINSYAQGTGVFPQPKESVVDINFNFTADNNCNVTAEFSVNNGSNYFNAVLHNDGNGQNYAPGTSKTIYIDVAKSIAAAAVAPLTWTQFKVRLKATDRVTSAVSSVVTAAGTITVKGNRPTITSFNMALWVGQALANAAPFSFIGKDFNASNVLVDLIQQDLTHTMRTSTSLADLDPGTVLSFDPYNEFGAFNFGAQAEGAYAVYIKIYDQFYNASDVSSWSTYLQRNAPQNTVVKVTGSTGSNDYTGIKIASDSSFAPDRSVKVEVAAKSTTASIPLSFQILTSSDVELTSNVGITFSLTSANAVQTLFLTTNRSSPSSDNFNRDQNMTIAVQFTDAAGNITVVSQTIRLNTRVYTTLNKPLRRADAQYRPLLKYVNGSGQEVVVPQTVVLSSERVRSWNDTYYPTSHGYPTDASGVIDLGAVLADSNLVAGIPTVNYDPVLLEPDPDNESSFLLVTDEDNRPLTDIWTTDGTKNYSNMESDSVLNPRYWVLDNTGYGDIQLEFERFDLDPNHFGPPFNRQCPYRGDVLVVYDANAAGALVLDPSTTTPTYRLGDTTKLKEVAAFTGQGVNVMNLTNGTMAGANANGGFISSAFVNMPKLVMMLFTDYSGTASGFRLKSGKGRDKVFSNYDVDYTNGQMWIHLHSTLSNDGSKGASDTTEKRLYYDYIANAPVVNVETGDVVFNASPSPSGGIGPWVDVDWSYYNYDDGTLPGVNTYVASNDDFVDYYDAPIYVIPADVPGYLNMRGVVGTGINTPDTVALSPTGDFDIRVKCALDDWTPAALAAVAAKYTATGGIQSWYFAVTTTGLLQLVWIESGGTSRTATSAAATGFVDGSTGWVRAKLNVSNGGQYTVDFYYSTDGVKWSHAGASVIGVTGVTSVFDSTAAVEVGSRAGNTLSNAIGKFYKMEFRSGIDKNLLISPANFEDPVWVDSGTTHTSGEVDFFGGNTAMLLRPTSANVSHANFSLQAIRGGTVQTFGWSCYVKPAGYTTGTLQATGLNGSNGGYCHFNTQALTVNLVPFGTGSLTNGTIAAVGNGWYRITFLGSIGSDNWVLFGLYPSTNAAYVGDPTKGIYWGNPMVEEGGVVTSYERDGVGGTVVANPDFTQIAQAATSNYYDGVGNLWTTVGTVTLVPTDNADIIPSAPLKAQLYETAAQGRIVSSMAWDKDRGTVEITPSGASPSGRRLSASYSNHTFTRLSNDGFGDLTFRDKIIVPDVISQFPDFTYTDVKIVNEGNADLQDMQVKFVPRGYDTNNDGNVVLTGDAVVDQVLDINRPWDVQKGTKEETYEKMAMAIRPTYDFNAALSKSDGGSSDGLQPNATAVAILSTWQNRSYGVLDARGKAFGRVVWVLGGSAGTSYPASVSSGEKRCALEVSGKYYSSLLI